MSNRPRPADRALYEQLSTLTTESQDRRYRRLDREPLPQLLRRINDADAEVPRAIRKCLPQIERATRLVIDTWSGGGRLFYAGAGTSGRLGVLDAAELPPTFGLKPRLAVGIIAGGRGTLVRSREGVEDSSADGARQIRNAKLGLLDCLIAIAASRRTPFTLGALAEGRRRGARTIFLVANPSALVSSAEQADVIIPVIVGPEVVAGSTRMKAGTAQKLVLNMITTAAMIRLGKTYQNLMVDLRSTSAKLRERSRRILAITADVDYETAGKLLKEARGSVKHALVMARLKVSVREADRLLANADGFVFRALGEC